MTKTITAEIHIDRISDVSFWLNRIRTSLWHHALRRLEQGAKEVTIKVEVT